MLQEASRRPFSQVFMFGLEAKNRHRRLPGASFQGLAGSEQNTSFREASRRPFSNIFRLRPKNRSRRLPGGRFQAFLAPSTKALQEASRRYVFKHFQARSNKSLLEASIPGGRFHAFSGSAQKIAPGGRFQTFPGSEQKIAPGGFQTAVFKDF